MENTRYGHATLVKNQWKRGALVIRTLPDWCMLTGIYTLCILPRRSQYGRGRFFLLRVFYLYLCGVIAVTLMPVLCKLGNISVYQYTVNLIPFTDFLHGWGNSERQLLLNVLLFLPFGVLLPNLTGWGVGLTLAAAVGASGCIELLQPFFDRRCDITDLITNVIGGGCGYLLQMPLQGRVQCLITHMDK